MTWVPFCTRTALGHCNAPRAWLTHPYGNIDHILCSFSSFKRKHLFKWIWCMETLIKSHVTISACPGITLSFTSSGSPNDITQHFFLKFVSCTVIIDIPLKRQWAFLWIFPHFIFLLIVLSHSMYQMVHTIGLCTVYFECTTHFRCYGNFLIHNLTIMCGLTYFGECMVVLHCILTAGTFPWQDIMI